MVERVAAGGEKVASGSATDVDQAQRQVVNGARERAVVAGCFIATARV
jgi:hypothetical protein